MTAQEQHYYTKQPAGAIFVWLNLQFVQVRTYLSGTAKDARLQMACRKMTVYGYSYDNVSICSVILSTHHAYIVRSYESGHNTPNFVINGTSGSQGISQQVH